MNLRSNGAWWKTFSTRGFSSKPASLTGVSPDRLTTAEPISAAKTWQVPMRSLRQSRPEVSISQPSRAQLANAFASSSGRSPLATTGSPLWIMVGLHACKSLVQHPIWSCTIQELSQAPLALDRLAPCHYSRCSNKDTTQSDHVGPDVMMAQRAGAIGSGTGA